MTKEQIKRKYSLLKTMSEIQQSFHAACRSEPIEVIKYFLLSEEFGHKVNIHHNNETPLKFAIYRQDMDIINFLLFSPELKEHAKIHTPDENILNIIIEQGYIDVLKLVMTTSLKEGIDLHVNNDILFKTAVQKNWTEIINYFIYDLDLEETASIKIFMYNNKKQSLEHVRKSFALRDLKNELKEQLPQNTTISKKSKI